MSGKMFREHCDPEEKVLGMLREIAKGLSKFPDGRINYSGAGHAVAVSIAVKFGDEILLLKRSSEVGTYKGFWSVAGGFLDEPVPLRDKVMEELREEAGITEKDIKSVRGAPSFEFRDKDLGVSRTLFPFLVELKQGARRPRITLNWEHTDYKWAKIKDVLEGKGLGPGEKLIPGLIEGLKRVIVQKKL